MPETRARGDRDAWSGGRRALGRRGSDGAADGQWLAQRYEACWAHYNAARWDDFRACHAPDATFDFRGLDNWWLDVETKIADLKRLGIVAPGDRAEIELVVASEGGVVGIVRMIGVEAGRPVQLRIGERVRYDANRRIKEDFLFFDAAWKTPGAPVPARVVVIPRYIRAEEENNDVVERLLSTWGKRGSRQGRCLLADDVAWTDHGSHQVMNKTSLLAYLAAMERDYHGYHLNISAGSFGGDFVAVTGTLEGEVGQLYARKIGAKPTPNTLEIPVLAVFQVTGGKVHSAELFWQSAALEAQLGVKPPPP